jgi:hypothetical protein
MSADFWCAFKTEAEHLSAVGVTLATIMPTSAPVERSFQIQGYVHNSRRASLAHETVEAEVFIRMNVRNMSCGRKCDPDDCQTVEGDEL